MIADAQLAYTQASAGAQIALMNPGGIRASLTFANSPGGEAPGQVTYGEAFTVQPFNNLVVTQTFTGAQIKDVLEQQFPIVNGALTLRILQVSAGFTYTYNSTAPAGSRISNIALNGIPIDPAADLPRDDERLPGQRRRRFHRPDRRNRSRHRTRFRRGRAGRLPGRRPGGPRARRTASRGPAEPFPPGASAEAPGGTYTSSHCEQAARDRRHHHGEPEQDPQFRQHRVGRAPPAPSRRASRR